MFLNKMLSQLCFVNVANLSMVRDCQNFYSPLAQIMSGKKDLPNSISTNWVQTKVCFGLIKSDLLRFRGLKIAYRKTAKFEIDSGVTYCNVKIRTR